MSSLKCWEISAPIIPHTIPVSMFLSICFSSVLFQSVLKPEL